MNDDENYGRRTMRKLGYAITATVIAIIFPGASTAKASESTALCTAPELICASKNIYTGHIEAVAILPTILSSITNITCEKSHVLANALGLGNPLVWHIELLSLTGNCKTSSGTACTVTTTELGLQLVLKISHNQGIIDRHNTKVQAVCGFFTNCSFGGTVRLTITGSSSPLGSGSLASFIASKAVMTREGGICPATAEFDATYKIELPHQLYLSS